MRYQFARIRKVYNYYGASHIPDDLITRAGGVAIWSWIYTRLEYP